MVTEPLKLLLADDSVAIQKVVQLTFADEGIQVKTVSNGIEALEQLEAYQPDIVLADVSMPGLNGYEVCERIKRNKRFKHTPVVLLVGIFEPFDEKEAREAGADDVLTKPFQSIRQLVNKVGALLTGRPLKDESLAEEPRFEIGSAPQTDQYSGFTSSGAQTTYEEGLADNKGSEVDDQTIEVTPFSQYDDSSAVDSPALAEKTAASSTQAQTSSDNLEPRGSFASEESYKAVATEQSARRALVAEANDDTLLDLGEAESLAATAEADDDVILDLGDEPLSSSAPWADQPTAAAASAIQEVQSSSEASMQQRPSAPEFAKGTGSGVGTLQETGTAAAVGTQDIGRISLDQLPPELIDAIAQRAVERLSEKVIEEIAWEVVPQLAEILIKRRLDSENPRR